MQGIGYKGGGELKKPSGEREAAQSLDTGGSSSHPKLERQWEEVVLLEKRAEKLELWWPFQCTLEPRR